MHPDCEHRDPGERALGRHLKLPHLGEPAREQVQAALMEYLKSLAFRIVADELLEGLQGAALRNSQSRP